MRKQYITKIRIFLVVAIMLFTMTGCKRDDIQKSYYMDEVTIVSLSPAQTEILLALGMESHLVGVDTYSAELLSEDTNIPTFDMMQPDAEALLLLLPDLLFTTSMSSKDGVDDTQTLNDMGLTVIEVPSPTNLFEIETNIRCTGDLVGKTKAADEIVSKMDETIKEVIIRGAQRVKQEGRRPKVYFEISSAPTCKSFGTNTFLNEMIELLGAENIFQEEKNWVTVSEEAVILQNPDIIFTNVNSGEDPVEEIMSRNGWDTISAIKNKQVYYIDADLSSRPSQHVIEALLEMEKVLQME